MRHPTARRGRGEEGIAEVVIIFPVAMVMILLVIQTGMWFLSRAAANDAAADGARAAAALGGSVAAGQSQAESVLAHLAGHLLVGPSVTVTRSATRAQVAITAHTESILPVFSLPVSASAAAPVEVFRP